LNENPFQGTMFGYLERCVSGLNGSPGKTVCRKAPRVRIPPSPLRIFFCYN
jgi:hypothetical protein